MTTELPIPAAQYLRMSTEHQQYSIENQARAILQYAATLGFAVIRTYSDPAKSGVLIKNRPGLRGLIRDVTAEISPPYRAILVYDVSRWGRFQDTDEAAHYEFLCRSAGVAVHYCAEQFTNDGSMVSSILKSVKRMMAAEYSRELSTKVLIGLKNLAQHGFNCGARPGFGLRRMLVSKTAEPKQLLGYGQRKNIGEDRVILTPGPEEERECVRRIFQMFLEGRDCRSIANELNRHGIKFPGYKRKEWYGVAVGHLLRKPKYCGELVYARTTQRLHTPRKNTPKDTWIGVPDALEPIVSEETFNQVQKQIGSKAMYKTDDELLAELKAFAQSKGMVKAAMLTLSCGIPSWTVYANRFGSFSEAVALAGLGRNGLAKTATRRKRRALRTKLMEEIVSLSSGRVSIVQRSWLTRPQLRLRNGILVSLHICSFARTLGGKPRWILRRPLNDHDRTTCLARLDEANQGLLHCDVIPKIPRSALWTIQPDDAVLKDGVQLNSLTEFESAVLEVRKRWLANNP